MTKFVFQINYKCVPGNSVAVVGSVPELGEWEHGRKMNWNVSNIWRIEIDIQHLPFEYKYQIVDESGKILIWEATQNRNFYTNSSNDQIRSLTINDTWEQPSNQFVEINVCFLFVLFKFLCSFENSFGCD